MTVDVIQRLGGTHAEMLIARRGQRGPVDHLLAMTCKRVIEYDVYAHAVRRKSVDSGATRSSTSQRRLTETSDETNKFTTRDDDK